MTSTYWLDRIAIVKAQIAAMDQALLEFAIDSGKQTVSMDTGQTRVSYTRADMSSMKNVRAALLNELATLEVRAGVCSGSFYGR